MLQCTAYWRDFSAGDSISVQLCSRTGGLAHDGRAGPTTALAAAGWHSTYGAVDQRKHSSTRYGFTYWPGSLPQVVKESKKERTTTNRVRGWPLTIRKTSTEARGSCSVAWAWPFGCRRAVSGMSQRGNFSGVRVANLLKRPWTGKISMSKASTDRLTMKVTASWPHGPGIRHHDGHLVSCAVVDASRSGRVATRLCSLLKVCQLAKCHMAIPTWEVTGCVS